MMPADLDRRAELTLWPGHRPTHTVEGQTYPTLRGALSAAAMAIAVEDAHPWIITEAGDILSPRWIRANDAAGRAH